MARTCLLRGSPVSFQSVTKGFRANTWFCNRATSSPLGGLHGDLTQSANPPSDTFVRFLAEESSLALTGRALILVLRTILHFGAYRPPSIARVRGRNRGILLRNS